MPLRPFDARARPIPAIVAGLSFLVVLACSGMLGDPSSELTEPHNATIQAADVHLGLLATASEDRTVGIWSLPELAGVRSLHHPDFVVAVAFSPDGSKVATGARDGQVRLWSTETWTIVGEIDRDAIAMDWAGDHIALAVAGAPGVELWRADTLRLHRTLTGHSDGVFAVRFSPDGTTVATGSKDNTARLWDVETGEPLQLFAGHAGVVLALAMAADGKRIVTGSSDKTARLWDVRSGEPLKQLSGHQDWVVGLDFRAGDDVLASVGRDGRVRLWDGASGANIDSLDYDVGPFEDVHFVDGVSAIAVGEGVHLLDFTSSLDGRAPDPPATIRPLDPRCAKLLQCGVALVGVGGEASAKGGDVVRMAREIDLAAPEMCTTTLLGLGSSLAGELPEVCRLQ